jgi:hypothetical protein
MYIQGPFCPDCGSIMQITGERKVVSYLFTNYHCPACNFDTKDWLTNPLYFDTAIKAPPGDLNRCTNCGAFAWHPYLGKQVHCRRCGAPNPNLQGVEQETGRLPETNRTNQVPGQAGYQATSSQPPIQYVPGQVAYQPVQLQPPVQYVVIPESKPKPGCWGIGLGILTILIALIIGIITLLGLLLVISESSGYGNYGLLILGVILLISGLFFGALSMFSGKKIGKILCLLYIIFGPILYIGVVVVQMQSY